MLHKQIEQSIITAVKNLYGIQLESVVVTHPEKPENGDFSCNVALVIAKSLKQSPLEIAKNLCYELQKIELADENNSSKIQIFEYIDYATPGFINFHLSAKWLKYLLTNSKNFINYYGEEYKNKKYVVEYTDPNPFKVFHIGHLMTNCIGESIARIYSYLGADVKRVNYQGDVGMHVSKSIWGLQKLLKEDHLAFSDLGRRDLPYRIKYLGQAYTLGANAYKDDPAAAKEMQKINYMIFVAAQEDLVETTGWVSQVDYKKYLDELDETIYKQLKEIYLTGRKWSLDYFETIYKRLGTKFDNYYFERLVGEFGYKYVMDNIENGVFEESDGAIIFDGTKHGLHTRVFINSLGLPTYEAKDLGLAPTKYKDYKYDKSIIVTANEINEYFKVVLKAMSLIEPDIAAKTVHLGHGVMKFKEGKMSSRTGNIVSGEDLINDLHEEISNKMTATPADIDGSEHSLIADTLAVSALKYLILKYGLGNDIIYDREQMLNVNGNTGPYLMYAYVRAQSVLEKAGFTTEMCSKYDVNTVNVAPAELSLLRELYKLPETVELAATTYSPNLICNLAFTIAQKFNTFYAESPILTAESIEVKCFRLHLTQVSAEVLKQALNLLGINTVDHM